MTNPKQFPDAYRLAAFLGKRFGATAIVDIGCYSPESLMALTEFRKIGRGPEQQIAKLRALSSKDDWLALDFTSTEDWSLHPVDVTHSVVICAGALETLSESEHLMQGLAKLSQSALATILVVDQSSASDEITSPRLTVEGFRHFVSEYSMAPSFVGRTIVDRKCLQKCATLAIIDCLNSQTPRVVPENFCPLAVVQTYNDIDIAPQTIQKLLDDGIEVHARDNWSTDGTFDKLLELTRTYRLLTLRRFPDDGPTRYHNLVSLLRWKEQVAGQHPNRWIISYDSDEVRSSPWPNISLRGGLYLAETSGFNSIDFSVLFFRPCDDRFGVGDDPEKAFTYFEFGHRPGHFRQMKAWRQPSNDLDLVSSAGHEAIFPGRRPFPYKFLFKHYPLRNSQQAYRKIFHDRLPRYNPETLAKGWHVQYNEFKETDPFLWNAQDLIAFDETNTRQEYLVELISEIGIVR